MIVRDPEPPPERRRRRPVSAPRSWGCWLGWSVLSLTTSLLAAAVEVPGSYARDHVIVKFKEPTPLARQTTPRPQSLTDLAGRLGLPPGTTLFESGFARWRRSHPAEAGLPETAASTGLDLSGHFLVHAPPGTAVEDLVARLGRHELVEYAELDHAGTGGGTVPNDPEYPRQWHHPRIRSPEAWELSQGARSVVVAVLDTGLDPGAVEFKGRALGGYDFVNSDEDPADDDGHGTAVAGVLAANANNGNLVAGLDWNCRLLPVKVLNHTNWGLYSWWADGIDYAVTRGAKVINLSAGGEDSDVTLARSIANAVAKGVIVVAIAHNDGKGSLRFPARLPTTIAVGATERNDTRASFSNWGPELDLVAPGRDIATVSRAGTFEWWWGTSVAAPQVAGVVALLAAVRPNLTHETARTLLCRGAEDQVGDAKDVAGFDPYYGWGRLNAYHTLLLAQPIVPRVDRLSDGRVRLRWPCPANAGSNKPYGVQYADDLSHWITLPGPANVSVSATHAEWVDDGTETTPGPQAARQRFYRVFVRGL